MPFYEYECTKCHNQLEILQKISDPPVKKCELCSGKMKKMISQSTFHLKGTGWYVTDYAGRSGKASTARKKKDETPAAEAKKSKTDTGKSKKAADTPATTP